MVIAVAIATTEVGSPAVSRVAVFGAGYVGLVTGACFAELGHDVVVRDVVPGRIEQLRAGEVPIYEPGLEELLQHNAERLTFTLDPKQDPKHIDMMIPNDSGTPQLSRGIYKIEGDVLTLTYNVAAGPRPTSFEPGGRGQSTDTYRRQR